MTVPAAQPQALLEVRGLSVRFRTMAGAVNAVNGLDLTIGAGEIVGLVGEFGLGQERQQPRHHGPSSGPHQHHRGQHPP